MNSESEEVMKRENVIFFIDNIVKKQRASNMSGKQRLINRTGIGFDILPLVIEEKRLYKIRDLLNVNSRVFLRILDRYVRNFTPIIPEEVRYSFRLVQLSKIV